MTASATRVVFAVTSSGRDLYSAMTRLAVASLRLTNPDVAVVVACDPSSDAAIRQSGDPLQSEVDEWVVIPTPDGSPDFRNRFVRTSLRSTMDGPFLFLDSDVLVRGDLRDVLHLDVDLAAAANHSREDRREQMGREDAQLLALMNWEVDPAIYFNAGVVFVNDTDAAHRCCTQWHDRWLASAARSPLAWDQPAMNAAVFATRPRLHILPARFNAQIRNTITSIPDAIVWHYYASVRHEPHTAFELAARAMARGGGLGAASVDAMIRSPHPWRRSSPLDDLAARSLLKRGRCEGWAARWLRRELGAAIRRRVSR